MHIIYENLGKFLITYVVVSNIFWRLIMQEPLHFYGVLTYLLMFILGVVNLIYAELLKRED